MYAESVISITYLFSIKLEGIQMLGAGCAMSRIVAKKGELAMLYTDQK
jgi:hypothetical protein